MNKRQAKRKLFWAMGFIILFLVLVTIDLDFFTGLAEQDLMDEYIVFVKSGEKEVVLYRAEGDGHGLIDALHGKNLSAQILGRHLLVLTDESLLKLNPVVPKVEWELTMADQELELSLFHADQGLLKCIKEAGEEWFVLDLMTGHPHEIDPPPIDRQDSTWSYNLYNPDREYAVSLQKRVFSDRYHISISRKTRGGLKKIWSLPENLTVLPDTPVWSPTGERVAFYAREKDQLTGFYSLYMWQIGNKKMELVQEQVFAIHDKNDLRMQGFCPNWSFDGRYLIFSYLPYGMPVESALLKFDTVTGGLTKLSSGPGLYQYPEWSPSGSRILFLSGASDTSMALMLINADGKFPSQISSNPGFISWFGWYKP